MTADNNVLTSSFKECFEKYIISFKYSMLYNSL